MTVTTTPQLRPWQRTLRTVVQVLLGLAVMVPLLVAQTGLQGDQIGWLSVVIAACALITRIMATPAVEAFLQRFAPWLSATSTPVVRRRSLRGDRGAALVVQLLTLAVIGAAVLYLAMVLVALRT